MRRAFPLPLLLLAIAFGRGAESDVAEGPDPRYARYDHVVERVEAWAVRFPEVFHREVIGHTHAGAPIVAARIGRTPAQAGPRPTLLFLGAQHANEALGTNAILELMRGLLEGNGRDPAVTRRVEGLACWFVPVMNVDGHRKVFEGVSGWEDWRKNGRDNDGDGAITFRTDGVDLNRNWDHRWEADLSTNPAKRSYKGPKPFSEPEVVAVRDLVVREQPLIVVDYHSPGTITPPNRVFWPWLFREENRRGPDAEAYRAIANELARRTETEEVGVSYKEAYAFDTLPKAQSWIYRTTGACVLLMEISDRCWWEGPVVDEIARRVAQGATCLLDRALRGPGLVVHVQDRESGRPLQAEVRIVGHHDAAIGPRRTDARHGIHRRLLQPGRYRLTVHREAYATAHEDVVVAEGAWTNLEMSLSACDE